MTYVMPKVLAFCKLSPKNTPTSVAKGIYVWQISPVACDGGSNNEYRNIRSPDFRNPPKNAVTVFCVGFFVAFFSVDRFGSGI